MHIPGELAGEICDQRQLSGTAPTDAEVLPATFETPDNGQSGLGDYMADGSGEQDDNDDGGQE